MRIETDLDGKTVGAIERHYFDAKEKHPYFCDDMIFIPPQLWPWAAEGFFKGRLAFKRQRLIESSRQNLVEYKHVLDCELAEMDEAIVKNNKSAAVEECYDAIAVLLRVVDVLEGRQALGKPGAKKGAEE